MYCKMYIDIIATQKLSVNEKNLDLYSEMILRVYNKDTKFVYELYYRIYIDIRAIQKSNMNEKSFNLYFKTSVKSIIKT